MMTRKDFVRVAAAIEDAEMELSNGNKSLASFETRHAVGLIIRRLGDVFAADNPRFDRDRFERACNGGLS